MECRSPYGFAHSIRPVAPSCLECDQEAARKPDVQQLHALLRSLVRTISWRLGSKTSNPARRAAAERVLPAPNTPLIANPVRPSHRANTIALKVARTCPSSSWRSGKRAVCNALCSSFSQQTVSDLLNPGRDFTRNPGNQPQWSNVTTLGMSNFRILT